MRHCRSTIAAFLLLGVALLLSPVASRALADLGGCARCGASHCNKVCRLVREDKKVQVTCWAMQDEPFCVPGPSKPGCRHCEMVCTEKSSDPKAPCAHPKRFVWYDWCPSCRAKMYTKHKLMKKVETKTIPSFKWVVEDLCAGCKASCPPVKVPVDLDLPKPPVSAANLELVPGVERE